MSRNERHQVEKSSESRYSVLGGQERRDRDNMENIYRIEYAGCGKKKEIWSSFLLKQYPKSIHDD